MTSQTPTPNFDNAADEASSLLTIATASPAPSFSLRQDGVATTTKKNGVPMRAMIATCVLLGTLIAVLYGGRSSTNSSSGDISAALVLGQNQAASVYNPDQDYCFQDKKTGQHCWYPTDNFPYPAGQWGGISGRGNDDCGDLCTKFAACGGTCDDQPTEDQQNQGTYVN